MFNILALSFSDSRGGAAIAAGQHVRAAREINGVVVDFVVAEKKSKQDKSSGPSFFQRFLHYFFRLISLFVGKLQVTSNSAKHSLNLFSSLNVLNALKKNYDCVHVHWINNDTLSISALRTLLQKDDCLIVITMHDDWLLAGSEHYTEFNSRRYIEGYSIKNVDVHGLDLDRWSFNRKLRLKPLLAKSNVIITSPSVYLQKKAKESFMLEKARIVLVPNIIDCLLFSPKDKDKSRRLFGVDPYQVVILFGAIGGMSDLKGGGLLLSALQEVSRFAPRLQLTLISFGGSNQGCQVLAGYNCINVGHISSKDKLAALYSCADITIVPSKVEAFGQVAAESLACQTPVIAFNNSGLTDIVNDGETGLLVEAFSSEKLALAIIKMVKMPPEERSRMGRNGRAHVLRKFDKNVVKDMWKTIYKF